MSALIAGELAPWPTKDRLAAILRAAGLPVYVGRYSVRVEDCSHFVFQNYGGNISEPTIEADAESVEELTRDARLVSDALARADIRHRFEIYDDRGKLVGEKNRTRDDKKNGTGTLMVTQSDFEAYTPFKPIRGTSGRCRRCLISLLRGGGR